MFRVRSTVLIGLFAFTAASSQDEPPTLGLFEGHTDVGTVLHPGAARYDANAKTYVVSGSGENMWFATDDFQFVWKKISAEDVALTANISILGSGGDGHRKGALMIRQDLDTDSAYVDIARHGEGLTSLQFRETKGETTREIESNVSGPTRMRLEKRGDRFYWWVASEKEDLHFAGGSAKVVMQVPFYVGIGVCAHNKDAVQEVAFSDVQLATAVDHSPAEYSTVETVLQSGDARAGYVSRQRLQAPGWSADGHELTFQIDGKQTAVPFAPLRTAAPVGAPLPAKDPKGYFASSQSGSMQVWTNLTEGGAPEQMTSDAFNNVSPSLSPDGKQLLFLSYARGLNTLPKDGEVELRMMSLIDKQIKTLAKFVGGVGSLGPSPWSPDGRRATFISYQTIR